MTPTKLLVGQILIVFAIVIAGVWFATEWCAAELGFQPQLSLPWFVLLEPPWRARQNRLVTTYGSSRLATSRETEAAGLFRSAGVFLGRLDGKYLHHDGPEHVMAFAPIGSGKGVGLVVPTLPSWTGSAVIYSLIFQILIV